MKKLLTLALALALVALAVFTGLSLGQEGQQKDKEKSPSARTAFSPCDVLEHGGTVFDPTECEQLLRKGSLVKNKKLFTTPGTTLKWKIVPKKTAPVARVSLEGLEVVVVSRDDPKSVVTRTRTGKDGNFQFTIPSNASGELQLQLHPATGQQVPSFSYCYLPPIENVLTPMCEDDPPLVCLRKKISPCSQANTQLLDRLRAVEACDKAEKEGRVKEAKNCRDALKNVPSTFHWDKTLARTSASACPAIGPGNGPAGLITCWSGSGLGCAWAICCGGGTCCGSDCLGPGGCKSE